ncbi:MAG TPA: 16S rRNA (guanine(527)-N(7))-methyltransferase RsmG [Sphingomonas sp.]
MIADVPRETRERLALLQRLVLDESARQNLIAASSVPDFESRHIADSLQLLPHLPAGTIVDIGSGAGFPGLVIACCRNDPIHLVEPRARRAEFLARAAEALGVSGHAQVHKSTVERIALPPVSAITARAVAALPALFAMASHLSDSRTRWVLPKGRSASTELDAARRSWQGDFRLIPSTTYPEAAILIAEAVTRR